MRKQLTMHKLNKKHNASQFDRDFDQSKDMSKYIDLKSMKAHYPVQRINVDIPKDIIQKVDREAARIGVTRTSLFKMWISEHLDHLSAA